jgi:4-hydroxy-tetrahydrodipicolinate reductase
MKIIINGAGGRMGKALSAIIENSEKHTVAAYCSMEFATDKAQNIYNNIHEFDGEADCIIDFSNHLATADVIGYAVKKNLPIVVATTGQSEEELAIIKGAADSIPVFYSQNMSLGVALLSCLAKIAVAGDDGRIHLAG